MFEIKFKRVHYSSKHRHIPNTEERIKDIRQYRERIANAIKNDIQVEGISYLCDEINSLDFEYPISELQTLHEFIFGKINESILMRDHYSTQIYQKCAS
jgi:hypothetical protein